MTYKDLIVNIEIVINSIYTVKDNYIKNVALAQEKIDTMINKSILPCNIPSLKVYGDTSEKIIKLKCAPDNLLTMYMSLTNGYELSDTVHYDNFTNLAQTNTEFIRDLTKRYNNMIRRVNLKSNTVETLDIKYYTESFNFASYDDSMFDEILEILNYEFELRLGLFKSSTFDVFKDTVYHMIKRIDAIYGLSHEKFDANKAWRSVFASLSYHGFRNHTSMCRDQKFTSLEYIYHPDQLHQRMPKKEYAPPPPPPQQPIQKLLTVREEMLKFMKLPKSFNEKQLKKRFRKLAIEYHPDKHGEASKFIYLKECYDALKKTL